MAEPLGQAVLELTTDGSKLERGLRRARKSAEKFGATLRTTGRNLSIGLTLPMIAAGVAAVKMAADFDDSLSQIVGLVGVAREQVDAWRGSLLQLSKEVGKAPKELAEGLFFVTSAGLRGAKAMEVLTLSAKASAAGLGDTAVVADAVTSALNAYGIENLSAAKATGILVATVREGKTSAAQLAPVLGRLIPLASELGVGFDEVGASMAFLTRLSGDASQAATQLRGILAKMIKPTEAGQKALKNVGLSMDGIRKSLIEKGLLQTLRDMRKEFGDDSEALGKVFEDVNALAGVLALTGANAQAATGIFARLAEETGQSLAAAFDAAAQSAGFKFRQAMATLNSTMIILGDAILPQIIPLVQIFAVRLGEAADKFAALSPATKRMIVVLAGLTATIGPLLVALGFLVGAVGVLASPFIVAASLIATAAFLIKTRWQELSVGLNVIFNSMDSRVLKTAKTFFKLVSAISPLVIAFRLMGLVGKQQMQQIKDAAKATAVSFAADFKIVAAEMLGGVLDFVNKMGTVAEAQAANMNSLANAVTVANLKIREDLEGTGEKISRFADLWTTSAEDMIAAIKNFALEGAASLGSLTGELLKGEKSFDEFARAAVIAITKILIKLAALQAFGPLGGAFAGGIVGAFAHGGNPPVGKASIVGEEGPELIVPRRPVTVIPSTPVSAAGGGGGGATTITLNGLTDLGSPGVIEKLAGAIGRQLKNADGAMVQMARAIGDANEEFSTRAI